MNSILRGRPAELREIMRLLLKQGFELKDHQGHVNVLREGKRVHVLPGSPSDSRWYRNELATLRRKGLLQAGPPSVVASSVGEQRWERQLREAEEAAVNDNWEPPVYPPSTDPALDVTECALCGAALDVFRGTRHMELEHPDFYQHTILRQPREAGEE